MFSPETPPPSAGSTSGREIWAGVRAGATTGSQVGGTLALLLTLLTFGTVAYFDPARLVGGWFCCFPLILGAPLFFGGLGGGAAGQLGGLFQGWMDRPMIGAVAGLVAGLVAAGILAMVWWICFPNAPGYFWFAPAGTLLAVVIAGICGGLADRHAIYPHGQTTLPGPFRRLFGFAPRVRNEADRRWQPPVRKPEHPQGIEEKEEGLREEDGER
jgi:hypothetical protein